MCLVEARLSFVHSIVIGQTSIDSDKVSYQIVNMLVHIPLLRQCNVELGCALNVTGTILVPSLVQSAQKAESGHLVSYF